MPNLFSFLTSLDPNVHNVTNPFLDKLDPRIKTLADILGENNYTTLWVGPVARSTLNQENLGLRNFSDIYSDIEGWGKRTKIVAELQNQYKKEGNPFFIYLFNPGLHFPYPLKSRKVHEWLETLPEDFPVTSDEIDSLSESYLLKYYNEIFSQIYSSDEKELLSLKEQLTPRELLDRFRQLTSEDATSINVDRQKLAGLRQRVHYDSYREFVEQYGSRAAEFTRTVYDVRLNQIDHEIKNFIDFLLSNNSLLDDTIIVFLSDHGEEFLEHGGFEHHSLYNELLHIPLIIKIPGMKPERVKWQSQTIDIFPTILNLIGIKAPESIQGRSMAPIVNKENDKYRTIISSNGGDSNTRFGMEAY